MTNTETPQTFQVGAVYSTGEANDYTWRFKVVSRTAKFITITNVDLGWQNEGDTVRVGTKIGFGGHEIALPLGSYSMAPVINADDVLVPATV